MTSSSTKVQKYGPNKLPLLWMMITGGLAGSIAEIATIPLDTAKVRMQVQNTAQGQVKKYNGMLHCVKTIIKEEGALSLYQGLSAGLQRQMLFASLRIGLYEPVKNLIVGDNYQGIIPIGYRILAALATGAIGITIANPTDVVKVRFQVDGRKPKNQRRYTGVMHAYKSIIKNEGVLGLWTGLVPNIFRNSIINAAQIATFDQVKDLILHHKLMNDNIFCHIVSSSIAGFTAAIVGSPIDVIKTRIMNAEKGQYSGVLDCIWKTFKNEGPLAFYKGFEANAARIVTWNIVMFVSLGQIRRHLYETSYKGIEA